MIIRMAGNIADSVKKHQTLIVAIPYKIIPTDIIKANLNAIERVVLSSTINLQSSPLESDSDSTERDSTVVTDTCPAGDCGDPALSSSVPVSMVER